MTNLFGHRVRSELLFLYVAEGCACFATVYLLLSFHASAASLATAPGGSGVSAAAFAVVLALSAGAVCGAGGLYDPDAWSRAGRVFAGMLVAVLLLSPLAALTLMVLNPVKAELPFWLSVLEVLLASLVAIATTRLGFACAWYAGLFTRAVVAVRGRSGDGETAAGQGPADPGKLAGAMERSAYELAFTVQAGQNLEVLLSARRLDCKRVWAIVGEATLLPQSVRSHCSKAGIRIIPEAEFYEHSLGRLDTALLQDGWLAGAQSAKEGRFQQVFRRTLDVSISLAMLLVTLPVLLLTALAVKLDSPGPVFYRQDRVGRDGSRFSLLKFRSMRTDAEAGGAARWATRHDPRVTRVGRLIRLTRIDEIPQVLNVLRGDMAFVGPRPERPAFVAQLGEVIPRYEDRACVKPGITGWAQVNFPYGASVEDARMKLAYDLYYIKRRSIFLDLLILVATVRVVLFQEGSR